MLNTLTLKSVFFFYCYCSLSVTIRRHLPTVLKERKKEKQTNKEKIISLAMAVPRQLGDFLGLQIPSMPQVEVESPSILKPRSHVATHVNPEFTSDWFLHVVFPLVGEGQLLVAQVIAKEDKMWLTQN